MQAGSALGFEGSMAHSDKTHLHSLQHISDGQLSWQGANAEGLNRDHGTEEVEL